MPKDASVQAIMRHFLNKHYSDVVHVFQTASVPIDAKECRYVLAISYAKLDEFESALNELVLLKKDAHELPDYFLYLAQMQVKNNHVVSADRCIRHASINRTSLMYIELKLEISLRLGKLKAAQHMINVANTNNISSFCLLINQCLLLILKKQYAQASEKLAMLKKKFPKSIAVYDQYVRLYRKLRQYTQEYRALLHLVKMKPTDGSLRWRMADLCMRLGRNNQLNNQLKTLKKLDKDGYYRNHMYYNPANVQSIDAIHQIRHRVKQEIIQSELSGVAPIGRIQSTPFYFTYHHQDNRSLFEAIASFQMKHQVFYTHGNIPKRTKKKIGVISAHLKRHSVMDFYFHTIHKFPLDYHVTLMHIGYPSGCHVQGDLNKRANAYYYLRTSINETIKCIKSKRFDMIIYPEIGMSPIVYTLAMHRLSPIQMALVGHPDTMGIPTIDYYMSWQQFHRYSKNPNQDFTETLVQLKNHHICYDDPNKTMDDSPNDQPMIDGLSSNDTVYFVPMTLIKIHPFFDDAVIQIIQQDPSAKILFVKFNDLDRIILKRLSKRLTKAQQSRVIFSPIFKRSDYYRVLKYAYVVLETFPFGGGNTMLQSLAVGTPYISLKSPFLRGSFGTAYYNYIGHTTHIASTVDEYVSLAIQAAHDPKAKTALTMVVNAHRHRLFNNMDGVNEFYDWIKRTLT